MQTPPDPRLARRIVALMNQLIDLDRAGVERLVRARVPCNQALADHPFVQAGEVPDWAAELADGGERFEVGLLGILNGIAGKYSTGWGAIAARFENHGDGPLINFEILPEKRPEAPPEPPAD